MNTKMNKLCKIIYIMIIIIIVMSFRNNVSAQSISTAFNQAHQFVNGSGGSTLLNYTTLNNVFNAIYNFIWTVAIVVAVIWGFVIAGRMLRGSVNEKADTRQMILEYVRTVIVLALVPAGVGVILKLIGSII